MKFLQYIQNTYITPTNSIEPINFEKTSNEPFFLRRLKKTSCKFQCNQVINIVTMDDFIKNARRASSSDMTLAEKLELNCSKVLKYWYQIWSLNLKILKPNLVDKIWRIKIVKEVWIRGRFVLKSLWKYYRDVWFWFDSLKIDQPD